MLWFRLASHLRMPKALLKKYISSMEFKKWQVYFDEFELNGFHREDYYLAQIAQCIIKANAKDPEKVKLDTFIIKFGKSQPKDVPLTLEQQKKKMVMSRQVWSAVIGVGIPMDDLMDQQAHLEEESHVDGIGT